MVSLKSASLGLAIVSVGFVVVLGTHGKARSSSESSGSKIVQGEVSQVVGEFHMAKTPQGEDTLQMVDKSYVITSQAGEEVRLQLDDQTKVRNRVNPGDKIEVKISPEGRTLSVTRLE
jgi:hypothetical protein